jgi:hypothetical protein
VIAGIIKVDWQEAANDLTMKIQIKYVVVSAALLALLNSNASTPAESYLSARPAGVVAVPAVARAADSPAVLDSRRRFALGEIETGNDDLEIGGAGEVSRYQIMPSVWRQYSSSRCYHDPATSLEVAQQHWSALYARFKQQAHREPTDFDMYVLWNTRYGYYAGKGFSPDRLNAIVRDRAQRFVNLVQSNAG